MKRSTMAFITNKIIEKLRRGSAYPAFIAITNKCNLKCPTCYFYKRKGSLRDKTDKFWIKKFDNLKKEGYLSLWISGGEPCLRMNLIKEAAKRFKYLTICTNGIIKIDPRINCRIFVSIDGLKEQHNEIRGKGTFEKIVSNYGEDKRVIATTTITSKNYEFIGEIVKSFKTLGFGGINFTLYHTNKPNDKYTLSDRKMAKSKDMIIKQIEEDPEFVYMTKKVLEDMVLGIDENKCRLKRVLSLLPDGTAVKCPAYTIPCTICKNRIASILGNYKRDWETFKLALKI